MILVLFILIVSLLLIIIFHCLPAVQLGAPWSKTDLTPHVKAMREYIDDYSFHIDKEGIQTVDHSQIQWGSVHRDGPSKSRPNECWWVKGQLTCLSHPNGSLDKNK